MQPVALTPIPASAALAPSVASARLMRLARAAWVALALFLSAMFTVGSVVRYFDLLQPCEGPAEVCGLTMRLRPANLEGLASPEAALQFHAVFYTIEQAAARVILWGMALLVFARRRDSWMALLTAFWMLTHPPPFAEFAAAQRWTWLAAPIGATRVVSQVSFSLFLFLFPSGRFAPGWMRWVALAFIALYLSGSVLPDSWLGPSFQPTLLFVPVVQYAAALVSQIYRYRRVSTAVERQQTKWVVFGIALAALFLFGTRLWTTVNPGQDQQIGPQFYLAVLGFAAGAVAIPITLGIAILRYRLFAIDILINRALVYGTLTACVVGAYVAIVGGLGVLLHAQANPLAALVATGVIAVAFQPLRERVQRGVNRLMVGERDDPYGLLTRLGVRLEGALEPAAALPLAVETVAEALKLPYVAINLKRDGVLQAAAAHGTPQHDAARWALSDGAETIGELVIAPRAPNEPLSMADRRLLGDLARQISVAARAALLAAELEQARLRLVAAHEEARRRLGSDLHDGVGHQLAGLARQTERAGELLDDDPAAAREMLTRISGQLTSALALVRSLAHQLHPPELELLGLAGALREHAQGGSGLMIRVDAPETLPRLPAAVETAAYYIAREALANVTKHAGARACQLRLALSGDGAARVLELEIADDGRGLPPDRAQGLGLLSMQARAAEVGGTCRIEPGAGGGTRVSVRLPCPAPAATEPE